jgi:hypothetical protein
MPRKVHHKIEAILSEEHRAAYEELLRQPGTTIDDLWEWLSEHGYTIGRSSVARHRKNFDEVLNGVRQSAELARAFGDVAKEGGVAGLSEASLGRFQQLLMEKLFSMDADGEEGLDSGELMKLSIALKGAVATKQQIEALKAEYAERQKNAIEQAQKVAAKGGDGSAVIDTIKQALGLGRAA